MISEHRLMRRVAGYHDLRLDGISDLVLRARGASVFDIGCNRGLVGFELANNGAILVHGCDNYREGIETARGLFIDLRTVESRFEVVDLKRGPDAVKAAFGKYYLEAYDIVVLLATYHKLKRQLDEATLNKVILHFGKRTKTYFAWRGYAPEVAELDRLLETVGLQRIHYSEISQTIGPAAIWARV